MFCKCVCCGNFLTPFLLNKIGMCQSCTRVHISDAKKTISEKIEPAIANSQNVALKLSDRLDSIDFASREYNALKNSKSGATLRFSTPQELTDLLKALNDQEESLIYEVEQAKQFCDFVSDIETVAPPVKVSGLNRLDFFTIPELKTSALRSNTNRLSLGNFITIDVETTGLDASADRIVEISAVKFVNYKPIQCMTSLINPNRKIPKATVAIHGITDEMVANSPAIETVAQAFIDFIGKSTVVAHNISFDLGFLYASSIDLLHDKRKFFDTLELSRKQLSFLKNKKLATACRFYGIYTAATHRSMPDAVATGLLFEKLVNSIVD